MNVSRKRRVINNSIANGIYQIILLISGLILPRFILVAYGSDYNGLVASITQFLGITELLTMGLASTARVELYASLASDDSKRTSAIVKAVSHYMYKAAGVFLAYMSILLVIYPKFVKGTFAYRDIASLIIIIGVGNILTYVWGYAYNVLLDADNTNYYYTYFRIFLIVSNVIISILLISRGLSIQAVKLISGIILSLGPLFLLLIVPRMYKLDRKVAEDNSWKKNRKYAAANSVALIIHDNTDAVILTVFTTAATVSVYSIYNLVIKGLKGILSVFTSSMEALFGNMWVKNELVEMKSTLYAFEYFIGFYSSISLSVALGLILPFVALYTRGVTDTEYVLPVFAVFIIIAELVRCIRIPYLTIVQAAGKYKETQVSAFIEAGLNIVISVVLTLKFGIVGVVVGTVFANLYRTIYYSWFVSRYMLNSSFRHTFKLLIWSFFNIFLNVGMFNGLCSTINFKITSWFTWISGAMLIFLLSLGEVLLSSCFFYKDDMKIIKIYINKVVGKLKNKGRNI